MTEPKQLIETAYENRAGVSPGSAEPKLRDAVRQVIDQLDAGTLRVAEKVGAAWTTHQWVKKAVLLSFRLDDNVMVRDGYTNYYDKVAPKFAQYGAAEFRAGVLMFVV